MFKMYIFKNILISTRKSHREMYYELVRQDKIRQKPVPAVLHSPHCPQADFGSPATRLLQRTPITHSTISFSIFFKFCGPASDL
jgi:hypothetical protein